MLFAIKIFDKPEPPASRDDHRQAHLDYLKPFDPQTLFAGPILTEDLSKELGSHRLIEFPDRAAAEAHIAAEPYVLAGIQEEYTIEHFRASVSYTYKNCPRTEGNVQYLIQAMDRTGAGTLREELRAEHEAYQARVSELYITRGPILDADGGNQTGSLMIIDVPDLAAATEFWENEPFFKGGLFARVEFYGWRFGRVFDRFKN